MEPQQLEMPAFWQWLNMHPNCIVRAGTDHVVLYDLEDLHWHLGRDPDGGGYLIQVLRGKQLVGELHVMEEDVAYVQPTETEEDGHTLFDVFVRSPEGDEVFSGYHFLMAHGLDDEAQPSRSFGTGGHGPGGLVPH